MYATSDATHILQLNAECASDLDQPPSTKEQSFKVEDCVLVQYHGSNERHFSMWLKSQKSKITNTMQPICTRVTAREQFILTKMSLISMVGWKSLKFKEIAFTDYEQ